MNEATKTCRICLKDLPLNMYGEYQVKGRLGKSTRRACKKCRSAIQCELYRNSKDLQVEAKERSRKSALKNKYGLTQEDFQRLYESQDGKCAICLKLVGGTKINVDHCHKTGKVRGLLCWNCNIAIGYFKDNTNNLKNALKYLEMRG